MVVAIRERSSTYPRKHMTSSPTTLLCKTFTVAALLVATFAAGSANASLMGVRAIRITSTNHDYLQIGEVIATESGTGADVALTATATSEGVYADSLRSNAPLKAIDGNTNQNYYGTGGIFHSSSSPSAFLNINLGSDFTLDSLTIFGRSDCCTSRNMFDVSFFDMHNNLLFSQTGVDASGTPDYKATVQPVPEPASIALLGLGLLGFAAARRKSVK